MKTGDLTGMEHSKPLVFRLSARPHFMPDSMRLYFKVSSLY
jgi:hypothetical protein